MYHPRQSNLFYAKVTFSYNIGVSNSNISNVFLSSHLRYFPCEIPILIFEGFFQTFSHGMGTLATMGLCHRPGRILIIPTRGLACMETRLPYGNICIAGCACWIVFQSKEPPFIYKEELRQPAKDDRLANISSRIPSMCVKLGPSLTRQAVFYLSGERHLGTNRCLAGIGTTFS